MFPKFLLPKFEASNKHSMNTAKFNITLNGIIYTAIVTQHADVYVASVSESVMRWADEFNDFYNAVNACIEKVKQIDSIING